MEYILYLFYFGIAAYFLIGTWYFPSIAITAILCDQVFDFWGQLISPYFFKYSLLSNLFVVFVAFVGVLRSRFFSFNGNKKIRLKILAGFIVLSLFAFLSVYWAPNTKEGLHFWLLHFHRFALTGLITPIILRDKKDLQITFQSLVIIGALMAILINVFVTWDGRYMMPLWGNTGFWGALEVSQLAGYVTLAAVLINFEKKSFYIFLRLIAILASIYLCINSGTRGQFLLMIILSIAFLPISRVTKRMTSYIPILLFVGFIVYAVYIIYFEFIKDSVRWGDEQVEMEIVGRFDMISRLLEKWFHQSGSDLLTFFFGLGNSASWNIVGKYPHNVPLEILAEEGAFGFSIFIILIYISIKRSITLYKLSKFDPTQKGISTTLIASFLFSLALSFKQGAFVNTAWNIFFFPILIELQYRLISLNKDRKIKRLKKKSFNSY